MGQNGSDKDNGTRFAAIREVRAYWDALRDDQDLPRREQVNPRGMAGALHQVFMVERIAPGLARFRLAGMEINDLMGMEVRGMPISALFDPAARARLLLLPLKGTAGEADLILGCLASDGQIGRAPRRFVIARALETRVDAQGGTPQRMHLALPATGTKTAFAPRPAPVLVVEMAEPVAPKFVGAKPASSRPYLRLVQLDS